MLELSKFDDKSFNIIFTSHTLEHVPHFRLEKTISEFNRNFKKEGVLNCCSIFAQNSNCLSVNNKTFFKEFKTLF